MVRNRFWVLAALIIAAWGNSGARVAGQTTDGYTRPGDLIALIAFPAVQDELRMTEKQRGDAKELSEEFRRDLRAVYAAPGVQDAPDGTPPPKAMESKARYARRIQESLLTADQQRRLGEISLQVRGGTALLDEDLAQKLEISSEQKRGLEEARKVNEIALRKKREEAKGIRFKSREDQDAYWAEHNRAADQRLLDVLTSSQREKFKVLQGAPFDVAKLK